MTSAALKDWTAVVVAIVPLLQTLVYVALIIGLAYRFRDEVHLVFESIRSRVTGGAAVSFAGLSIGAAPTASQVSASEADAVSGAVENDEVNRLTLAREQEYQRTQGLYIYHGLYPTREVGQKYSVGLFVGHHVRNRSDKDLLVNIESANFFIGNFWRNEVFAAKHTKLGYGCFTSAYGEFLVVCEVTLASGEVILLNRYIDFRGYESSVPSVRISDPPGSTLPRSNN